MLDFKESWKSGFFTASLLSPGHRIRGGTNRHLIHIDFLWGSSSLFFIFRKIPKKMRKREELRSLEETDVN